jgi:T-complex protein 1 subunit theta
LKNVEACKGLAAITRTSLGPNGMNKLVVNHLEKLFITSDAATIVEELEIAHPAAKMLARAASMQVQEVGDGGNFVVTFAGELLSQAESLLRIGVHPSEIVEGYKKAMERASTVLEGLVCFTLRDARERPALVRALEPVLAAKHHGYESLLAGLVADACLSVMPSAPKPASVSVDNVRVTKLIGGTLSDSQIVRGVVVQRDAEGAVKHVEKAKIAVFGCSIEAASSETKGTVVIHNAEELMSYNKGEERMMEESIRAISEAGAKGEFRACARAHAARGARSPSADLLLSYFPFTHFSRARSHRGRRRHLGDRHALHREVRHACREGCVQV